MNKSDFSFELPPRLIAQHPAARRGDSRLLALDRRTGGMEHKAFNEIVEYFSPGDCLVLNNTRVIPARLIGRRERTGGPVELLLLKRLDEARWEVLARPGRKCLPGEMCVFGGGALTAVVEGIADGGCRIVRFSYDGVFEEILDHLGEIPLPPYIKETLEDKSRYQTVYAARDGSSAAPTAGLHFTRELLGELKRRGVYTAELTLHIGLGTFRPVKSENILEHHMHAEYYEITESAASIINRAKNSGRKVTAVGTTSCRALESRAGNNGLARPGSGWTDIFIYPGYEFKIVDRLVTNFHLPESTLIMLAAAMAGRENVLAAYRAAVEKEYKFFSFGDAMLIL
ncbi:MAG: tRNA preQ1(34) S-adenosylmethionine ribosyltransferase-isomerase QueA [Clostridiales bacterium]|jgi:S-adenosylmethionine:tRNA ribosyltransferase-isomerase|nr:tRNA preQ1(34) S-adenosylmethionine ribosyltransferase-isomerase QueA [Clostridiales bacterium]